MINREMLSARIEAAFPAAHLLPDEPVLLHGNECLDCSMLISEMDQWFRIPIDRPGLALFAGMQRHLTPGGWRWFVTNFLRLGVVDDNPANRIEIDSLIWFLSPSAETADLVIEVLDNLSLEQLGVLVEFLHWLATHEFWQDYSGHEITAAIEFLNERVGSRSRS
ncbi:MAG: hypothetical protein ABI605_12490 [Rhizobacter sp.]